MAFEARYELAFIFIILSAVFDFFDGMLARLLNAHSPIGKIWIHWLTTSVLAQHLHLSSSPYLKRCTILQISNSAPYMPYAAFLIAVFQAYIS